MWQTTPLATWFPVGDWQFWAGTLVVLAAALWLARGLVRGLMPSKRRHQKKVTLTIGGEKARATQRP